MPSGAATLPSRRPRAALGGFGAEVASPPPTTRTGRRRRRSAPRDDAAPRRRGRRAARRPQRRAAGRGRAPRGAAAGRRRRRLGQDPGADPPDRLPARRRRGAPRARSWPSPSPTRPPPRCGSGWPSWSAAGRGRCGSRRSTRCVCASCATRPPSSATSPASPSTTRPTRSGWSRWSPTTWTWTRRSSRPRALAAAISNLKNELIDPATAADRADNDIGTIVADVYARYQARLKTASALDFDDLIMETVALLQTFPAVAEHYRRRFRHVLVDEYQDTNHAQYVLVRELVGGADDRRCGRDGDLRRRLPPAELVVVGDADQSIYAFRGATIRNIVEFERDYPTPGRSCSSRTTARRRTSCPRPTRSSPATRAAGPRTCGRRPAAASRSSATSPTTSTTRRRSSRRDRPAGRRGGDPLRRCRGVLPD